MKQKLLLTATILLAGMVHGGNYEFMDRSKDVDWFNPAHWRIGSAAVTQIPGAGDSAYATVTTPSTIDVVVTNDYAAALNVLALKAQPSACQHFYTTGEGTTFAVTASEETPHGTTPFVVSDNGVSSVIALIDSVLTWPVLTWTDPSIRLWADAEGWSTCVFDRGTFNFYDPDGTVCTNRKLNVFGTGTVIVDTNATVRLPLLYLAGAGCDFRVRGGTLQLCAGLQAYGGEIRFTDRANATLATTLSLGNNSRMLVDGGANVTCTCAGSIASSDRPSLIVSNATCTITGDLNDIGASTDGLVAVYDGALSVNGADAIKVATSGGNGGVELHGGTLTSPRIRLSRGAATAAKTAYFLQTAGTTTLSGSGIQFQQSCTDNNLGTHYVRLDGGVLKAKQIFRDATVTAGTVYLSADGGTWQPNAAADATLTLNLSYGEFGEKGLTLDHTRNYTLDLVGRNKTDAAGRFVKTGAGTLTLKTTFWTVAETVVAGGTLKANDNTALETALVVTNGATFSMVGDAATALTVSGLALTNAVLALDPGDVLTVAGPFALSRASLAFSSTPTLEEAQTFLVVEGELSDVTRLELLRLVYGIDLGADYHAEYEATYDADTGKTTVKLKKVASSELTETAVWTGEGAWASSANWQDGVKPDERKVAVFGAEGGETTVAAGDQAGALAFTSGAHRLSGAGPLTLTGAAGETKISVSGGEHTIATPVELFASTPMTLAAGTTLALDGGVERGALTKTGTGHFILGGPLSLTGKLKATDGLLSLTNAAAMAASSAKFIELTAGTLETQTPDDAPLSMPMKVEVAGLASKTSVVFKTMTDATFGGFVGTLGNVIKCGPAKMTIAVPANATYTLTPDNSNGCIGYSGASSDLANGILFKDDGTEPDGWRAPLNVVEGELVLKGAGDPAEAATAKTVASAHFVIGGPCRSPIAAEPLLTVDHCQANFGDMHNGYSVKGNKDYAISHPTIRVINRGSLTTGAGQPAGYDCTRSGTDCTFAITNGSLAFTCAGVYLTRGRLDSTLSREIIVKYFLNASRFVVQSTKVAKLDGSILVDNGNGSYFGGIDNTTLAFETVNANRVYGEIYTHGGSTLAMSALDEKATQTRSLIFAFDDGEWVWSATGDDFTWPASTRGNVIEMRGRGVILKPAAGKTFTTLAPFTGTGGVVVAGPGTVAFGAKDTCLCTGVCDVEQGTLDLTANETQIAALGFAGTGTVKGARVTKATIAARLADNWTTQELPVFTDCTLGKLVIDAGRTEANPLVLPDAPQAIAVAKFAGSTTPPGSYKLRNTGTKGVSATFKLVGDTLYMTPCATGTMFFVR